VRRNLEACVALLPDRASQSRGTAIAAELNEFLVRVQVWELWTKACHGFACCTTSAQASMDFNKYYDAMPSKVHAQAVL
jgi:hypothetical protein